MDQFYPAINKFVQDVLPALISLLLAIAAFIKGGGLEWLKSHTSERQYKFITGVLDDAVSYAAHYYKSADGQERRRQAILYAQTIFDSLKMNVEADTLAVWIEAAYSKRQDTQDWLDRGGVLEISPPSQSPPL